MNFFNRIGYELRKFMIGRYGIDNLGIILMVAGFVLSLFSRISIVISAISLLILGFGIFRMLSKNIPQRKKENGSVMDLFSKKEAGYRYFRCPDCSQKIRVPKGKGKIRITCPKCGHRFEKNT
ncbi:MAG: hypothetical protein IKO45_03900 [Clostridia bacterium]|nr:hypothetical protein [Clostridia bacterium]